MEATITWTDGMAFSVGLDGHQFTIDADEAFGGRNLGPRPKGLLLAALGGCTAMDVVSILQKMRLDLTGLKVVVDGTVAEDHPKRFTGIVVRYEVTGKALPVDRVKRAVELSEEKYCGISATLKGAVPLRSEIWLDGQQVA